MSISQGLNSNLFPRSASSCNKFCTDTQDSQLLEYKYYTERRSRKKCQKYGWKFKISIFMSPEMTSFNAEKNLELCSVMCNVVHSLSVQCTCNSDYVIMR